MTDEEIVLYFNEHRLAKLESYLLKDGSSVEHELQNLLNHFYEQIVPEHERMEVEAQITAEYHAQVTTLPLSAITPDETVWWIADGICTEIPAQIVQTDENSAWVSLPEGISVVNGEFDRCQQGVRVRIAEGTP